MEEQKEQKPENWFHYIPETPHIAPECSPTPTVQEHDKTITAQAAQINDLTSQITNLQTQLSALANTFQQYISAVHPTSS